MYNVGKVLENYTSICCSYEELNRYMRSDEYVRSQKSAFQLAQVFDSNESICIEDQSRRKIETEVNGLNCDRMNHCWLAISRIT